MDDFQYNWLMGSIRDFSSQQSLLFCRDDSPSLEGREPEHVLKEVFGYEQFRPLQREVIQNVLDGRDTLAVMPTGGGKSLCYEIPALILDGLTIVVSPLIALMQDQVTQLEAAGVPAVFINSTLGTDAYWESCARIRSGEIKLLYVSPEGLNTERMRELLHSCRLPVKCITIDEAHCISEWGHDFRPDYMEIAAVRAQFPRAVCLALTATATASVRQDIVAQLRMEDPAVLVASFNRPNIYLEVRRKQRPAAQLVEFLNAHAGQCGIIYCFSRRQVDELVLKLQQEGFSATGYHAGLADEERASRQSDFINGRTDIMVATVAFGMGINKPDVRFVVHYDMPKSIEQYYQEIGRAGRDGLPSHALLLYSAGDLHKIRYFFTEKDEPDKAERLLDGMVRFAEGRTCRRRQLLSYFGEVYDETGAHAVPEDCCCDICTSGPLPDTDVTVPAQKFMSCILRTEERFGTAYIVDVLLGSKNKRVLENGHTRLSTYGIGGELSRQDWFSLCSLLIEYGFVAKGGDYGVLFVTQLGRAALRTRQQIALPFAYSAAAVKPAFPKKRPSAAPGADDPAGVRIFEALRGWRRRQAEELNVPPYVIFGDRTLMDIARRKPQDAAALLDCYGIGSAKAEKFGSRILRIVEESLS